MNRTISDFPVYWEAFRPLKGNRRGGLGTSAPSSSALIFILRCGRAAMVRFLSLDSRGPPARPQPATSCRRLGKDVGAASAGQAGPRAAHQLSPLTFVTGKAPWQVDLTLCGHRPALDEMIVRRTGRGRRGRPGTGSQKPCRHQGQSQFCQYRIAHPHLTRPYNALKELIH